MIKDTRVQLVLTVAELEIIQKIVDESRKTGCKGTSVKDRESLLQKIRTKLDYVWE